MAASLLSRRALVGGIGACALAGAAGPLAARADTRMVALVHTQLAGDNGPIDGMIASLKRIGRDRALTVRAIYAGDAANFQPILELLGEAKAAVVLVTFNEMTQPLRAVAPAFPDTRFVQLFGDPIEPRLANVRTVSYLSYLGSFLSGICGALMSRSARIGFIGGANLPSIDSNVNAQIAGAKSVNAAIDMRTAFVGSFQDPAKALVIANDMFDAGLDYVQTYASASDLGVIQSANAKAGRIISGGSRPEFPLGAASMAAITLCDFERSLYQQAVAALSPGWIAGHYRSDLRDGVVDFVPSQLFLGQGPPAQVARFRQCWPSIRAARERIIAGTVVVPYRTHLG
jgi:basic membrane protein A and related proteins